MTNFNISNIQFDDQQVWDLICSGKTKGIFQCESQLVQHWLRKIQPRNLWELSIVIAIVRPGPLKSGFADEYLAYRTGEKDFESFGHYIIDEVFGITDHILVYQEQIMNLGSRLAWPDLEENDRLCQVDDLRKAVGKKNQEKILSVGQKFVKGCIENEVSQELADKLFNIIKNCGRYVFNLSHSMAYAYIAYKTAYLKTYYTKEFYATYLTYAKFKLDKWDEIYQLIYDLKSFNIPIEGPNINFKNEHFKIINGNIVYGLSHMKHFGTHTIDFIKDLPEINDWRQVVLLTCSKEFGNRLNKRTAEALISTGSFKDTKISRNTLLEIYTQLNSLTDRELEYLISQLPTFSKISDLPSLILATGEAKSNKKRILSVQTIAALVKKAIENNFDNPSWIEKQEEIYLGCPITATSVDFKISDASDRCIDCDDNCPLWNKKRIAVVISEIIFTETKKGTNPGQRMARISVYDSTGKISNLPIFPDLFQISEEYLMENNTVLLYIKKGRQGWIVDGIEQI